MDLTNNHHTIIAGLVDGTLRAFTFAPNVQFWKQRELTAMSFNGRDACHTAGTVLIAGTSDIVIRAFTD